MQSNTLQTYIEFEFAHLVEMDHLKFSLLMFIVIVYSSKNNANDENEETLKGRRLSNLNQKIK